MNLRLDLSETEMLAHMTSIDAIVAELELTGFTWTSESVRGLLYQLHMPSEMTKDINKDLDQKFAESNPNFSLEDIKSTIQIHLAREKTASETISINTLSTGFEAMSINRTPAHRRVFQSPTYTSPRTPSSNRFASKIDPLRWKRGPEAWMNNDHERQATAVSPISIPSTAVKGV